MKFTPEVIAALNVLRHAAENDFERHRINVLERDLTDPPVVEQIDDKHQRFNGITYRKIKDGHYTQNNGLHRDVWQYHYGDVPNGYIVHHNDWNPANNGIANLRLMENTEHNRLHMKNAPVKDLICEYCGKPFSTISIKHNVRCCSLECIQALHYDKQHEVRVCAFCGKEFSVYRHSKTKCCSQSCAAKLRFGDKILKEKHCAVCGKIFKPKHREQKACSKPCALKLTQQKLRQAPTEKTCPMCGKTFSLIGKDPRTICCSRSCAPIGGSDIA